MRSRRFRGGEGADERRFHGLGREEVAFLLAEREVAAQRPLAQDDRAVGKADRFAHVVRDEEHRLPPFPSEEKGSSMSRVSWG